MENLTEKLDKDIVAFDFWSFWRKLWSLVAPAREKIYYLLFFIAVSESINLAGPYILKFIIDLITNFKPEDINRIIAFVALMIAANQAGSVMSYFNNNRIFDILTTVEWSINTGSFEKLLSLDLGYHEKENSGSKVFKVQRGVDKLDQLMTSFFWEVIPTTFQIILTTATLFFVDWRFGLTLLFFVPIFVVLSFRVNRETYPVRKERYDKQEKAAGFMSQSIININAVKSFVQEKREKSVFSRMTRKVLDLVLFEYGKYIQCNLSRNLVIDLGRAFILISGIYLVSRGQLTVGTLVFVFTISEKSLISLYRISRLYDKVMDSGEAITRLFDLSQEKAQITSPKNGLRPKQLEGEVEFRNVSFVYNESRAKALDKVSFKINSGCTTALVGPSGGGKTTVARMVYRHYDPTKGDVMLDGKNLKDYELDAFRKFIAIVPQEVEIFNDSVKYNIAYAKPKASLEEVRAAARIANAEEFIVQLKDGYDTVVGERGIKLSGGQRQRIGIARAILANPRILIFDEATSNLDSSSEKLIQEAMDKVSKNRTVIVIAHRLSTVKKADKIVVLEKGKVVEEGSHMELARVSGGLYRKLLELQQMGDIED